ncbi:MAG: 50S ribosomal protein L30e [Candidatus Diapherotrites archaeon]
MDNTEAGKEIRRAVDTGKVIFGVKESLHAIRHGEGLLLVVAQNTPETTKETLIHLSTLGEIPLYTYAGTGIELGSVCGKPFIVSTLLIQNAGKSKVMDVLQKTSNIIEEKPKRGRKRTSR